MNDSQTSQYLIIEPSTNKDFVSSEYRDKFILFECGSVDRFKIEAQRFVSPYFFHDSYDMLSDDGTFSPAKMKIEYLLDLKMNLLAFSYVENGKEKVVVATSYKTKTKDALATKELKTLNIES